MMAPQYKSVLFAELVEDLTEKRWVTVGPLDDVVEPSIKTSTHTISVSEIKKGADVRISKRIKLLPGDLVFSRLHTQNGAFAFADREYTATQTFVPLGINERLVNREFLFFALQVVVPSLWASDSVGRETYKTQDILNLPIPLPPMSEQERIVTYMSANLKSLEAGKQILSKTNLELSALRTAILVGAFERAKTSGTKLLSEVCALERGKFSHRPRNNPIFFGGNHPWIQIGEIESADKYIVGWRETLNDAGLAISKKFPKGTIVVSIAATIGAVGILDFDCCFPDSIVGITPKADISGEYLYYFMTYLRTHLENIAPESARKNINLEILSAIQIPVPPFDEQVRIANYLDCGLKKVSEADKIGDKMEATLTAIIPAILNKVVKEPLNG